jgi:pyruvate/oxaloacetate carboxyltransferase
MQVLYIPRLLKPERNISQNQKIIDKLTGQIYNLLTMEKKDKSKSSHGKAAKRRKTDVITEVIKTPKVEEKAPEQAVPPVDTDKQDELPPETFDEDAQEKEPEKGIVQVLVKVPTRIRDKAKQEAELAYLYGWIPEPTVTALFNWLVDHYLDAGIKQYIEKRRGATEHPEGESHGG